MPASRLEYRAGLPQPGRGREVLNMDAARYRGGGCAAGTASRGERRHGTAGPARPPVALPDPVAGPVQCGW
ncbi:alpha amylase C-terminal domain-containing protein [Geminicoccus flavidas]|uniref:alpha amylase C-terminal domain-containing protein n=1 Tax=Geminicoccus flavidas TaxID=2506407 RepID=UPI0038B2F6FF